MKTILGFGELRYLITSFGHFEEGKYCYFDRNEDMWVIGWRDEFILNNSN